MADTFALGSAASRPHARSPPGASGRKGPPAWRPTASRLLTAPRVHPPG